MSPASDDPETGGDSVARVGTPALTQARIGVAHLASTGEITALNDAFGRLTSHPRDALLGASFTDLLTTSPPSLEAILRDEDAVSSSVALTLPVATGDGEVVACEALLKAVPDAEDTDHAIVAILYQGADRVADRTRGSAALPDKEAAPARAFVALADALSEGIIVLDTDSRIQYANPAVEHLLGYSPDELVGGSKLSIIPERLREAHLTALDRYLETGTKNLDWEYVELPGQHKDGREVPLGISLNDFFFDGDRYFVGLFRDISPRKAAERALREREQRLKHYKQYTDDILDAIDDMFYVLDTDGSLQRWNQTLCDVTGYTDEDIESMHALDFFDEDDRTAIGEAIERGFETGHTQVEADLVTERGEAVPYEFVASPLETPDGESVLAGIGRDVSERREHQRRLEASNERLEQFAYAASHDLQEPLRMITSYLQLIERRYADDLDESGEEFLAFAVDGAERMREMIEGLLEYSRVETEDEPTERVDLNDVVADVTSDLQLKIDDAEASIRVGDLPTVRGDSGQLRQVFQNLLSNAIEYSGSGPPTVEISAERTGTTWTVAVSDDGVGIDPEQTDRVFRVFQRLHTQDEQSGTGLGLALCQRIVERHGGRIWIESEPGTGSTFFFTLPDDGQRA
ncbi:sensor histidine kinase [Halosimplex sp. J119]